MRSEAWLADGLFDCHRGVLVLGGKKVSFLNEEGASIFDFDLDQVAFSFPWYLFATGLNIQCAGEKHRVLFANPYLDGGGVRVARGRGRLLRDALGTRQTDAPAVSSTTHRTLKPDRAVRRRPS